jgi:two-component system chemotaxis sensor kinase CheA
MASSTAASSDVFDMSQFHGVFFEETAENIAAFEDGLLHLNLEEPDSEQLNAIFRAAHSIKGGSGTFGFHPMAEVTHELETLLDLARRREARLNKDDVGGLLRAGDVLAAQLAFFRGSGGDTEVPTGPICAELRAMVAQARARGYESTASAVESCATTTATPVDPGYGFFDDVTAPETVLAPAEDSAYGFFDNPGAPASVAPALPEAAPRRRAEDHLGQSVESPGRRAGDRQAAAEANSIRVSVEKVDQLINMVGELVITQAMLAQAVATFGPAGNEPLEAGMAQLERNTRDLQESVMAVRMMPISVVFNRFPRLARDLSGKLGKEVQLEIIGEGTELDKGLIEKLADPLTHLVRNSIDHGIEMPEERAAQGKTSQGTITLRASHQGGNVVVEVTDDGRGLDRERILEKARERNIPIPDEPTDEFIWDLIFEAGFSTASAVTDLSGRGVGMDVVRRNINALGGRVELSSALGQGTHTVIRLPLTLAILEGMSVGVADQTFIIPLSNVIESLSCDQRQLKSISGTHHVIEVREEFIPVVSLRQSFGIEGPPAASPEVLVIIEAEGRRVALKVDALIGQHQVVIKSLETNYRRVEGVSGATIMGSGMVALILDVPAIVRSHCH